MNPGIKLRLTIFISTIALLLMLIAWTAHAAWQRIGELHEKFSIVQWQSFQIADHLQQTILGLNNLVLRYAAYRDPGRLDEFRRGQHGIGPLDQSTTADCRRRRKNGRCSTKSKSSIPITWRRPMPFTRSFMATGSALIRVVEFTDFEKQSKSILIPRFSNWPKSIRNPLIRFRAKPPNRSTFCGSRCSVRWCCCWPPAPGCRWWFIGT